MAKRPIRYVAEQLVLKVTLVGSTPAIWRRVEVYGGLTLDDLHIVIQCAFAWNNSHLHHYLVPPEGKLTQKAMRAAKRYHAMPHELAMDDDDNPAGRSDETLVGNIFTDTCKQIVYEYDFGDSWNHIVKLEKRTPGGDRNHVPVCIAGDRGAPLDDMGGIYGYYAWIDALANPKSDMHQQAVEWLGPDFDETTFDRDAVNSRLERTFKPAPKKARAKTPRAKRKPK